MTRKTKEKKDSESSNDALSERETAPPRNAHPVYLIAEPEEPEEIEPGSKPEKKSEHAHDSQIEVMTQHYYISVTTPNLKACSKQATRLMRHYETREAQRFNNAARLSIK